MYRQSKLLLTQSLLSSWLYQYGAYDPQKAHEDFLRVLRREPTQPNKAMLDGIQFENMVTACCEGTRPGTRAMNGQTWYWKPAGYWKGPNSRWQPIGTSGSTASLFCSMGGWMP